MKLSVSAYRAHASAHKKILSSGYHSQLNYGSTGAAAASSSSSAQAAVASTSSGLYTMDTNESMGKFQKDLGRIECNSDTDVISPTGTSSSGGGGGGGGGGQSEHGSGGGGSGSAAGGGGHHHHHHKRSHKMTTQQSGNSNGQDDDNNSNAHSSDSKSPSQRKSRIGDGASDPDSDWTRSNQRWMKLRTTVQISSAIQKKPPLKREDSFLKRFSTRQIPETQETVEDTGSESASGDVEKSVKRRRRYLQKRRSVVNPDENFYFYWLMMLTVCVLYNLWTLIVRQSFPELQEAVPTFWLICDILTDVVFVLDIIVQLRTGYLEQGLMVYDDKKLACHYVHSRDFFFDMIALIPLDLLQLKMGTQPLLRFTRFFKVYRSVRFYYIVESRTVWPNLWRVVNLIHILLILAHWFGCFYYLLSEAEGFQGDWVYPYRPGDYATLTRKYLGSLYWSTLTLTTIGDLPTPETNAEPNFSVDGPRSIPRRGIKSRLLQFGSSYGYIFTIVSYLIGVFIFATIVGQVGNVITNRNANRLEFERLLDGAKTYMRHHKVPGGMKRRVLRWYDYSWSRGRIQGGGDINTALGLLPDKLKTELALHVNLSVLKKVTIFQECQPEFLHDLVLKMKAYIFTPGDSICRKGEVAREMFIIADGILEVLSETGKVLTTMKAGDFFGEIGILNLDGLNKRTADVRSVGYSELFSLSREDVLAAMKDYPDAQEILQTLGRKRLMEVRCVNKKYAKAQIEKENAAYAAAHPGHVGHPVHQSDSSENSASKKIVDKLKHDVKGFRNVLKKSRTSRKSDESLEMQPLHNTSPRGSKTMLKRMSRVRSEEKDDSAEAKDELHDKTPSPIGAGLPLLQRLRLLKEKQDREERAVKSTPPQKSPPHSHVTCTLSPQESIQEEPEREFNEGFPLIQRLQQLKIRNEPQPSDAATMAATPITISGKVDTHANQLMQSAAGVSSMAAAATTTTATTTNYSTTQPTTAQSLTIAQIKPIMKVSFKQKIQQLQGGGGGASSSHAAVMSIGGAGVLATTTSSSSISSTSAPTGAIAKKEPPKSLAVIAKHAASSGSLSGGGGGGGAGTTMETRHKPIATISKKVFKPSYRSMPMQYSDTDTDSNTPIKPWSKLKLATLISSSYTSLTNCSPDDLNSPLKNFSLGNLPAEQAKELEEGGKLEYGELMRAKVSSGARAALRALRPGNGAHTHAHHHGHGHDHGQGHGHGHSHGHGHGHGHSHAHSSAMHTTMTTTTRECLQSISLKASATRLNKKKPGSGIGNGNGNGNGGGTSDAQASQRTKLYQSVFDLSPEYCGLPFVKRLKILNERQKLAELEKALQTRSFSLDCSKTNSNEVALPESLYRCYSDTSGIYSQFMTATYESTTSSATSSASASDNLKQLQLHQQQQQHQHQHTQQQQQHQLESVQQEYMPLSPESNETFERRKLKSILKKLHKSRDSITTTTIATATTTTAAAATMPTRTTSTGIGQSETYGIGTCDNGTIRSVSGANKNGMERDGANINASGMAYNIRDNNSQTKALSARGLLKEPTLEGPPGSAKVCGSHEESFCAFGQQQQQQQLQQQQHGIEYTGEIVTAPGLQLSTSALPTTTTTITTTSTTPYSSGSVSGGDSYTSGGAISGAISSSSSSSNYNNNNINNNNAATGSFVATPLAEIAWSPTALALVATTTPTNSPQDAHFTFDQQQMFTFNAAGGNGSVSGSGGGGGSGGIGIPSSSSTNFGGSTAAAAAGGNGGSVGVGVGVSGSGSGIVVGGIAYAAECSNNILSNTAFHAQSCTDLNLNLQLRQNSNSSSMSQVPRIEGFPEAQDYFNQILCGINDVIKTHMNDMHSKFELQFTNMASEVRRRDAIIQQLQLKLRSIETKAQSGTPSRRRNRERIAHEELEHERGQQENSSSGSSAELLFMRGDSLDTVFTSSPPMQGDRRGISSPGTSKHVATASASSAHTAAGYGPTYAGISYATQHGNGQQRSSSLHGGSSSSSSKRTRDWAVESARSLGNLSSVAVGGGVMVSDITGNLSRISDSVILDIGESSSSSSSSSKLNVVGPDDDDDEEDDDDDDNEAAAVRRRRQRHDDDAVVDDDDDDDDEVGDVNVDIDSAAIGIARVHDNDDDDDDEVEEDVAHGAAVRQHVHHNDWEVQMLAAEMERQERRRRGHSLSDNLGELKHCSSFLRRRRKFSDTETEFSEPDMDEYAAAAAAAATARGLSSSSSVAAISSATAAASGATAQQQQQPQPQQQQQQPSTAPTTTRPRASSLDQFNLRYGIGRGIFKAMSIDRDKDKL